MVTLIVIVFNSAILAYDDPILDDCEKPILFNILDKIFLIYYTVECILKIIGMGFLFN